MRYRRRRHYPPGRGLQQCQWETQARQTTIDQKNVSGWDMEFFQSLRTNLPLSTLLTYVPLYRVWCPHNHKFYITGRGRPSLLIIPVTNLLNHHLFAINFQTLYFFHPTLYIFCCRTLCDCIHHHWLEQHFCFRSIFIALLLQVPK